MAGGNGTVTVIFRIPAELRMLAEQYQKNRRMPSLNAAIIELLETHPSLAAIVSDLYTVSSQDKPTVRI